MIVDADRHVCPDQRKSARASIDYRTAHALSTQALGRTRMGRLVRTALAADGIDNLITHAFLDDELTWPLSIYEVSGDRDTIVARDPGLRRLDGINVHREIPATRLFGPHGADVVDLIEKLYYADRSKLANVTATTTVQARSHGSVEAWHLRTRAKINLQTAALEAGLFNEMFIANRLASRAVGLAANLRHLDRYRLTEIGCAVAATVVRDHMIATEYATLTAPLASTLFE
ncbi:hypothetical protein [Rhodococcus erythropolis]|uniref:hypothetical protein n=1 Tax=Rhodococcus erythropolis TaxID=1833 RepID=UPI00366DC4EF